MKYGKYIVCDDGVQYFHDDEYDDERIQIPSFPMKSVFGDFRIFNGLPLHIVDKHLGEIIKLFEKINEDHATYVDYWETHPNLHVRKVTNKEDSQ